MSLPMGEYMKWTTRLFPALCLVLSASALACSKDPKEKANAAAAPDTMLMHYLAEANRNTAAASAMDNSLTTVKSTSGGTQADAGAKPQGQASDTKVVPRPSPSESGVLTSGSRLSPPTKASDASGGTNVSLDRSPATGLQRASGNPCNSPAAADQRSCLNRSIATNDADLNRTYQELLDQARKSGGSELEDRFQQSQRDWVNQRDSDCTAQTPSDSGKLWAKARARCLADRSATRTAELQKNLNNLRGQ
ncbi:MAG TPA: lysozyme inhibitor LprI family protein [Gemmatimonadaceae bacterium]|nr:lysozyme inhibitor LprI family protein [Gemmatimonadaceae bacterium]